MCFVDNARDTEIQHLDIAIFSHKNVARFEVRVNDVARVYIGEGLATGLDHLPYLAEVAALRITLDELVERLTAHILHNHEHVFAIVLESVDVHNVGVIQLPGKGGFATQSLGRLRVLFEAFSQYLDGNVGIGWVSLTIHGEKHLAHGAFAKQTFENVLLAQDVTWAKFVLPGLDQDGGLVVLAVDTGRRYGRRAKPGQQIVTIVVVVSIERLDAVNRQIQFARQLNILELNWEKFDIFV